MHRFQTDCLDITRRHFLKDCGIGLGKVALASLLAEGTASQAATPVNPMLTKPGHFPGKAKAVIHLFMAGAPSHLDLFDPKPELTRMDGKPLPPSVTSGQRLAFIRADAAVMGPQFKFARHGQSGM